MVVRSLLVTPAGLPARDDPPLVLWIGRISVDRGPEAFVDVARELAAVNCDFVLIGPPANASYLEQVLVPARELPRFRYVGAVSLAESWVWIARAAVLVNTSRSEGVSNALVQAWHCGTPTVTLHLDPDGIIEANGVGFRAGDPATLARDVRRLVEDVELWTALGERARALAQRDFSRDSVGTVYEAIFRRVIAHA
jgi:glycosyltransferase involved in cell wall biosynthesis